jgi:hypothetical protein
MSGRLVPPQSCVTDTNSNRFCPTDSDTPDSGTPRPRPTQWKRWARLRLSQPRCDSQVWSIPRFDRGFQIHLYQWLPNTGIPWAYAKCLWAFAEKNAYWQIWNFSLHYRVQNCSGAHPASYPMGTRGSFPGGKAAGAWSWPLTSI